MMLVQLFQAIAATAQKNIGCVNIGSHGTLIHRNLVDFKIAPLNELLHDPFKV